MDTGIGAGGTAQAPHAEHGTPSSTDAGANSTSGSDSGATTGSGSGTDGGSGAENGSGTDSGSEAAGGSGTADAPTGEADSVPDLSSTAEVLPQGEGIDRSSSFKVKGYFRTEFKRHIRNVYFGYDDQLGTWTPRGSPYQVFQMVPPVDKDSYLELNFEASWRKFDHLSAYTDTSFVYSTTRPVQTTFEQLQDALIAVGETEAADAGDSGVPIPGAAGGAYARRAQERLAINELYLSTELGSWFAATAGKRRVIWGSAFTWSPMDVINPPRNPLEPTLQREGGYNVTVDMVHFDGLTLSGLYKPWITENERGIPTGWDLSKNLYVGRLYWNVLDADLNVAYYNNQGRSYGGLSFSRYFDVIEGHVEALVQRGRPTWLVRDLSPSSDPNAPIAPPYEVGQFELNNGRLYGDFIVGARYNFDDGSFLLGEYFYHGAAYNQAEYDRFRAVTAYMEEQLPSTFADILESSGSTEIDAGWLDLISGAPYLYLDAYPRRNYLGITYFKAKMFDLIEPKLSGVLNLDDLSGTLFPAVEFVLSRESGARGSLKFLAGALIFFGGRDTQVSLFPNRFTANFRMTAYF